MDHLDRYAKFGVALLGAAAVTLNYAVPILPHDWQIPATLVLVFVTALGVERVPNAPMPTREVKKVDR